MSELDRLPVQPAPSPWGKYAKKVCLGLKASSRRRQRNRVWLALVLASLQPLLADSSSEQKHGGSRRGKASNRAIGRSIGAKTIQRDYFAGSASTFSTEEFERRFRVPKKIWDVLREGICRADNYFRQKRDATGLTGASTEQKMVAAIRQLAYGIPADACVEYVRLSETTCNMSLHRFCQAVVGEFETEYLRLPTVDEIAEIEGHYAKLGFPGCIGCLDCASWEWDACPVGWQGDYKGKDKKPVCRMEVVADDYLRIYHCMFGVPGSKNDLNILNQSTLFNEVRVGKWPPIRPQSVISGMPLTWFYYLADGIYPRYKIFATSISNPKTRKEKLYSQHQESARKSVERVFGVLFKRFQILYRPSRLWHKHKMTKILKTCVIIHNMVAEERKHLYHGTRNVRLFDSSEGTPTDLVLIPNPQGAQEMAAYWRDFVAQIEDANEHRKLKESLIEYIWEKVGQEGIDIPFESADE
jgi:hypothetical protein